MRLNDVDRRQCSDLHLHFVFVQCPVGKIQRTLLDVQVLPGKNQVPVSLLRLYQEIGDLDFELGLRNLFVVLSNQDLASVDQASAIAQQVLSHGVRDLSGIRRVERIQAAIRRLAVHRCIHSKARSRWKRLREVDRVLSPQLVQNGSSVELRIAEVAVAGDRAREPDGRLKGSVKHEALEVGGSRSEPVRLDVKIPLDHHGDDVGHRHRHSARLQQQPESRTGSIAASRPGAPGRIVAAQKVFHPIRVRHGRHSQRRDEQNRNNDSSELH